MIEIFHDAKTQDIDLRCDETYLNIVKGVYAEFVTAAIAPAFNMNEELAGRTLVVLMPTKSHPSVCTPMVMAFDNIIHSPANMEMVDTIESLLAMLLGPSLSKRQEEDSRSAKLRSYSEAMRNAVDNSIFAQQRMQQDMSMAQQRAMNDGSRGPQSWLDEAIQMAGGAIFK